MLESVRLRAVSPRAVPVVPAVCASRRPAAAGGWSALLFPLLLAVGNGCSNDNATSPAHVRPGAAQAFWTLQLNQHAINLATVAPANTFQLTATPRNPAGVALTGLGQPTFQVVGDTTVLVDATGLLTARSVTIGHTAVVIASLTAQNYTLTDTALVQVTDTLPHQAVSTFSLQAVLPDSAKRALDDNFGQFSWPVRTDDPALLVYYASSNPFVASIDRNTGAVIASDTGTVVFTATTVAYGVPKADSIQFRIGLPLFPTNDCEVNDAFIQFFLPPRTQLVGVGAVVSWINLIGPPYTFPYAVTFADTTGMQADSAQWAQTVYGPPNGAGNIPLFGADTINFSGNPQSRRFTVPGTYRYQCSGQGTATGTFTILVQPG